MYLLRLASIRRQRHARVVPQDMQRPFARHELLGRLPDASQVAEIQKEEEEPALGAWELDAHVIDGLAGSFL